jgi:hypothetical protein
MGDDKDIRHERHCVFKVHVHVVFFSCASTSSSNKHRTEINPKKGSAVYAILPRPERWGLPRIPVSPPKSSPAEAETDTPVA